MIGHLAGKRFIVWLKRTRLARSDRVMTPVLQARQESNLKNFYFRAWRSRSESEKNRRLAESKLEGFVDRYFVGRVRRFHLEIFY